MENNNRIILFIVCLILSQVMNSQSKIETSSVFEVSSPFPLDDREVIGVLADTSTIDYVYPGLITYVIQTDDHYYYNGNAWKLLDDDEVIWTKQNNVTYFLDSVGVGTDEPTTQLQVQRSTSGNVATFSSTVPQATDNYSGITLNITGGGTYDWNGSEIRNIVGTPNLLQNPVPLNPRLGFFTQNPDTYLPVDRTEKVSILGDGNVGIGTAAPNAKLHIDDYYTSGGNRQFQLKHFNIQDLNSKNVLINMNAYYNDVGGQMTPINTGRFVWMQMYQNGIRFRGGTGNAGENTADEVLLHIDNSDANRGNVGIGTDSPITKLQIHGSEPQIRVIPPNHGGSSTGNNSIIDFYSTFDNYTIDGAARRTSAIKSGYDNGVWGKEYMAFLVGGSNDAQILPTERARITATGLGIGTTTPSEKLDVNGNARIRSIASGAYSAPVNQEADGTLTTSTSDSLLKRAIKPIKSNKALDQILLMQGVTYKWKPNLEKVGRIRDLKEQREAFRDSLEVMYITDSIALKTKKFKKITVQDTAYFGDSILINSRIITAEEQRKEYRATMREKQKETKKQIKTHISEIKESIHHEKIVSDSYNVKRLGVIAQQIQQVAPELVFQNQDGYLGVRYTEIIPLLIEGMKAQQKTIENLEKRIEKIEKE